MSLNSYKQVQEYYKLYFRLSDKLKVEYYEVISVNDGIYTVRIVFVDGQEDIEVGDLEHFNAKYEIIQQTEWV